jgi:hypothetical protein
MEVVTVTDLTVVLLAGLIGVVEEMLRTLGVGGQIGIAATLGAVAIWAKKAVSLGERVASILGTLVVFSVIAAILLAAGVASVDIGAIRGTVDAGVDMLGGVDLGGVRGMIEGVLP